MPTNLGNIYEVVSIDTSKLKGATEFEVSKWFAFKIRLLMRGIIKKVSLGEFSWSTGGTEYVEKVWLVRGKFGSGPRVYSVGGRKGVEKEKA